MKAMSPTDAMFLMMEMRRQPMHVGGLHLFTLPPDAGRGFVADFVDFLRSQDRAVEPFNLYPLFKRGRWQWAEDDQFDIEHHFRHSALPRPGRIRELLALVSRLHGTHLDRSRPMWELHLIEGLKDKRIAAYTKLHHAMFDGVAAMRVTRNTYSEDAEVRDALPPWARPKPVRPHPAEATAVGMNPVAAFKRVLGENLRIVPGVAKGLWDLVRPSTDIGDAKPYQAPLTLFNGRITSSRRFAAQSYSLARIKAVGKASGATLNDVVLAMCAGALREYLNSHDALPDQPLIAMVPVSVRTADGADEGNQVSLILANLATHVSDPGKRLQAIVASTRRAKQRLQQMTRLEQIAYAAAALSPMPLTTVLGAGRMRPAFNVVISNVPGPTKPMYWNGARLDEMYPISIPIDGQALNITLVSYCDQIGFGYTACRRSVPQMQRLLDHTGNALAGLEKEVS
jgi:diacylglycerol O-acyltransferase / wax synthase